MGEHVDVLVAGAEQGEQRDAAEYGAIRVLELIAQG